MIVIEILPNPNCDAADMRLFHELEVPHRVKRIRLERESAVAKWYEVTGWTRDGKAFPALAQKIDDSGEGIAYLIYGQDAGLRFKPDGSQELWQINQPQQWGLPFVLLTDPADFQ